MADRDSISRYLAEKQWRRVRPRDPHFGIVNRLVAEGRAEWISHDRVRLTHAGLQQLERASRER